MGMNTINMDQEKRGIESYIARSIPESSKSLAATLKERGRECRVTVVIPAHNEEEYIGRTLQSIVNMDCRPELYDIIVVNNDSKDNTQAIVDDFARTNPNYALHIVTTDHKGVGYARKTGSDLAVLRGASLIAQTDADIVVTPEWVPKIIEAFSDPNLAALRGDFIPNEPELVERINTILDYHKIDNRQIWAKEFTEHLLTMTQLAQEYAVCSKNPDLQETSGMLAGGNCAFTAEAYCAIGGYDPNINIAENKILGEKIHATGRQVDHRKDVLAMLSFRRHLRYDGKTLLAEDATSMHASQDFGPCNTPTMTLDDFRKIWREEQEQARKKIGLYKHNFTSNGSN